MIETATRGYGVMWQKSVSLDLCLKSDLGTYLLGPWPKKPIVEVGYVWGSACAIALTKLHTQTESAESELCGTFRSVSQFCYDPRRGMRFPLVNSKRFASVSDWALSSSSLSWGPKRMHKQSASSGKLVSCLAQQNKNEISEQLGKNQPLIYLLWPLFPFFHICVCVCVYVPEVHVNAERIRNSYRHHAKNGKHNRLLSLT